MLNSLQYHFAVMGLIYISDIGNGFTTDLQRLYNGFTADLLSDRQPLSFDLCLLTFVFSLLSE